jgi:hypothetical protein
MLVEVAKPVALVFSILSLYAVFSTAFLVPSSDMHERIFDSLSRLALAAVISWIGGLIFREEPEKSPARKTVAHGHPSGPDILLGGERHPRPLPRFVLGGDVLRFYRDVRF